MKKIVAIINVIIVLVIIGLSAVLIYPQIKPKQEIAQSTMSMLIAMNTVSYNSKFDAYFGNNKTYAETRALISAVRAHNNNTEEVDSWGHIRILKQTSMFFFQNKELQDTKTIIPTYEYTENSLNRSGLYTIGLISKNKLRAICEIGIYEQDKFDEASEYYSELTIRFGKNKTSLDVKALLYFIQEHNNNSEKVNKWGTISIVKQYKSYYDMKNELEEFEIRGATCGIKEKNLKYGAYYSIYPMSMNTKGIYNKIGVYEQENLLNFIAQEEDRSYIPIIYNCIIILSVILIIEIIVLIIKKIKREDVKEN